MCVSQGHVFLFDIILSFQGFPSDSYGKKKKNLPAMREIQVQSLGGEDLLEKGTVIHSGILAWRISWTEEPGGLQSMGSQRVRHD